MTKREWLLIGIVIVLCVVIAGCSSVQADFQSNANMVWINEVSDGRTISYQTFSEIQIPEHKITCFVFRGQGAAMQCFNNSDIYNGGQ
jgi:hypothetical protein